MNPQLSATRALELTSLVIDNDLTRVEPMIELLAGMTDARGDPLKVAIREIVLDSLYCKTADARHHRRLFTGEEPVGEVIQANFSAASVS